jgi:pyridoxal phosphate enzyme (YggS family)
MNTIAANLQGVNSRIEQSARSAGRDPRDIVLVAVTKTFGADAVRAAYSAGQRDFGESYVQEALAKIAALADLGLTWHFIGPVQSNKTRPIAESFAWVHTVDRLKVAERLAAQRPVAMPALQVCIEVNVSGEATKAGVTPDEVRPLAAAVSRLPRLKLRGLMAIPAPTADPVLQREHFDSLRALRDALNRDGLALDTLSMGMSDDFEAAIASGSTMVRVGTAIFGPRPTR